ncbi:phage tail sheath family protein [Christensenellaceae bacterium OttesenSCG-928-M15]|nr:phage tail sheath family protein [Christensenellaceae bacterium OttesenSCG-928-M15]
MAGGNWTSQNKVLPGVYTNVTGKGTSADNTGIRGIVALPMAISWLEPKTIIPVTSDDIGSLTEMIGNAALPVREALKYATTALIYRLNQGAKAMTTLGSLTATAKHEGVIGNSLQVSIEAIPDIEDQYYVRTFRDGAEMDIQQGATAADIKENAYITFSGDGALEANAGVTLSGGSDGTVTTQDYADALQALELQTFHSVACMTAESDVIDLMVAYAERLRAEEGKNIQAVVPNVLGINSISVLSVKNSYTLADGTALTVPQATAFVAGATAGVPLSESLTNATVAGAVDVSERYTTSQMINLVRAGQIVFVPGPYGSNSVTILKDINTLITYTEEQPEVFAKNKIIRTVDAVADTIYQKGYMSYIGKTPNTDRGRMLYKSEIMTYFRELEAQEILQNVAPEDINIRRGNDIDAVVVDYAIQPVDVMEKIYNTIVVKTV